MQANILLLKLSHEMEESGFTMEWKSQTQTSHHVLNTLGLSSQLSLNRCRGGDACAAIYSRMQN